MKFNRDEVPIAFSMIDFASKAEDPFQRYFCFWAAYNNIYTLVTKIQSNDPKYPDPQKRLKTYFEKNGDDINYIQNEWGYSFPDVKFPSERTQIKETINVLEDRVKDDLITDCNLEFFIDRIPRGAPGRHDSCGQYINGVLNITRTIDSSHPVWSPVDKTVYENYMDGDNSKRNILTEQIIMMLYTIRNNLFHGNKNFQEANDRRVVRYACPLLEKVVLSFMES